MKMIFSIVNSDDAQNVMKALRNAGIQATRLASTGGFLMKGNTTIISGVEDALVDKAIALIRETSKSRKEIVPMDLIQMTPGGAPMPVEITVGGATIFVLNVERFEKV